MIISLYDLPVYTRGDEKDLERTRKVVKEIETAKKTRFTKEKIDGIKKRLIIFKPSNEEILEGGEKLFFKIDKSSVEISKLFLHCQSQIRNIEEFKDYADSFYDLKMLKNLVEEIDKKLYGKDNYINMLQELIEPYRTAMESLVLFTQQVTGIFTIKKEEEGEEISPEELRKEIRDETSKSSD